MKKNRKNLFFFLSAVYIFLLPFHFRDGHLNYPLAIDNNYLTAVTLVENGTIYADDIAKKCQKKGRHKKCTMLSGSNHNVVLAKTINGHYTSMYSFGAALMMTPGYAVGYWIGSRIQKWEPVVNFLQKTSHFRFHKKEIPRIFGFMGIFILMALYAAMTGVFELAILELNGWDTTSAWRLAALFGVGTIQLTYAQSLSVDNVGLFITAASLYFFIKHQKTGNYRDLSLAGLIAGTGYVIKPYLLTVPLAMGISMLITSEGRDRISKTVVFGLSALLTFFMSSLYYWIVFGSPFAYSYNYGVLTTDYITVTSRIKNGQSLKYLPFGIVDQIIAFPLASPFLLYAYKNIVKFEKSIIWLTTAITLLVIIPLLGTWYTPLGCKAAFGPRLELFLMPLFMLMVAKEGPQILGRFRFKALAVLSLLITLSSQSLTTWSWWCNMETWLKNIL